MQHLRGNNLQPGLLEAGVDFTDVVLGDGVRFNDGKGSFDGHARFTPIILNRIANR